MKYSAKSLSLTTVPLALLITGAIDSIRNLPATALFGSSLIFFFIFSAIIFLIPVALISAELSAHSSNKNGIYYWVKSSLGTKVAVFAVWLQWINTMVWFPTILSFIAGTATYFINPALAQNKTYLVTVVLITYWFMTWVNLKGIHTSAKFANFCSIVGMVIPMMLIIVLGMTWIVLGKPLHIEFTKATLFPSFNHFENWVSLTAIMASFLGIELATVHIKEVYQPEQTFPKALTISVLVILFTMIFGSLSIALVLPKDQINLVSGVMQAFTQFFTVYHLSWFIPILTIMILIGSLGSITSWIISPAKSLLFAAHDGYLPPFFIKKNQHRVASNLLIGQAFIVSFVCIAFLLMPSVNGSYWFLTSLSTQLYTLMYVLMFIAAIFMLYKKNKLAKPTIIPGGKLSVLAICLLGLSGCLITLFIGFIPPPHIDVGSPLHYLTNFVFGMLAMILPVGLLYFCKIRNSI